MRCACTQVKGWLIRMEKEQSSLTLRKDIKKRANDALSNGYFAGINSLSSLVEKALEEILDRQGVPKTFEEIPEVQEA